MNVIKAVGSALIPIFIVLVIIYALCKKTSVYNSFIKGACGVFPLLRNTFPAIAAMILATGLLRESGLLEKITEFLYVPLSAICIPADIISLYIIRPFSGSGALSALVDIFESSGVDSLTGAIASTMMGSTETTIYTMALYFSAVGIVRTRYALFAAIMCDLSAMLTAVLVCRLIFS